MTETHTTRKAARFTSRGRRLAGMTQRNMIIGAAAAGVILVCSVIIWKQLFGGPAIDDNPDLGYKCSVCGEEFVIKAEVYRSQTRDEDALKKNPERTPDMPHCPKCGAKHSGLLMTQCPQCEKWFMLSDTNIRKNIEASANPVCPHCGLDLMEWKRQHR